MNRPAWSGPVLLAVATLAGGAAAAAAAAAGGPAGPASGGPDRTIELTVRHSRFLPSEVEVEPGSKVRFVIRNLDPIAHEFIIGDEAVHVRHASGTEAHHGDVPGEVSVGANTTAETTFTLAVAEGAVVFGCHLPGHWAYGMTGTVTVR